MTEQMQGLVSEAKKNKFTTIGSSISEDDVCSVWENVSSFIEKHMGQQKGVNVPGLGIFTFTQKKLEIGNNKYILIQRPVFQVSEKFAQTHGLNYTKYHISGTIPVVQLNYAALSFESPFDRETVESCVREVLQAQARAIASRKNVEFTFNGIGRLQIREGKVKMKFYKEFLNMMDGSGKLLNALKDRPGTVDSVMSDRPQSRPHTSNTLVLPKISDSGGSLNIDVKKLPTIQEDGQAPEVFEIEEGDREKLEGDSEEKELAGLQEEEREVSRKTPIPPSRSGSRLVAPIAQATGVSFVDDVLPPTPRGIRGSALAKSSPAPLMRPSPLQQLQPLDYDSVSPKLPTDIDDPVYAKPGSALERLEHVPSPPRIPPTPPTLQRMPSPPGSACSHSNAGQELCYLCHQRAKLNVPVAFKEERERREREEDRLLQQYQHIKDTENVLKDQETSLAKRHDSQKIAAFNVGVAEAVRAKRNARPTEFHRAYIFQNRPLTPPRFHQQNEYSRELAKQCDGKERDRKSKKADEEFLERLEQVQLAEDLAAQREQYLRDKAGGQEQYKRALSAQVKFKPLPIPAREPDSSSPIFGKDDMTNEGMAEQRKRAHEVYQEQLETVMSRKRANILKRLNEQKEEEEMLDRTKKELLDDRAHRYERIYRNRKRLESDWSGAADTKKNRELEDKLRSLTPGILVHEQCDKYHRCGQCKRTINNAGESNIWRDSRYIPGSRLMV
ncbi:unnamed protein product [Owenia fusiformis]|uniref:Uncharacterized protein n=1 Tax=Owenia fusiformis TaxID=6347 RepID=A0A8J1TB72_OWEFU|nr:unnamed protein product [Owenia fusiformis]